MKRRTEIEIRKNLNSSRWKDVWKYKRIYSEHSASSENSNPTSLNIQERKKKIHSYYMVVSHFSFTHGDFDQISNQIYSILKL